MLTIYMKVNLAGVGAVLFGICVVLVGSNYFKAHQKLESKELRVVFFDVGQGDSIFIQAPSGKQVLVDGGSDGTVLRRLSDEMGYFDRSLDMVVATHEDKDHVGGLPDVFTHYHVGTLVRTENQGESMEAHTIDDLTKREGSTVVYARRGMVFDLGAGSAGSTTLEILFPERDSSMLESNTSSIVARLVYGESEFLLTGDSPNNIEEHLVQLNASGLPSDVLKLGHHGSRTSSGETFLKAVHPMYAIVSAGKNNRYGHPHKEVVERLGALSIPMLNTAVEGNVVFESDGKKLEHK
jgi:competence protein ComEC